MNLMEGLNEICKLASPETLIDQNVCCLIIHAMDFEGHDITRVSGNFLDLMDMLDIMIDHIAEHSNGTLTRTNIIAYLQLYTEKEE